jgi:hypothetical protein
VGLVANATEANRTLAIFTLPAGYRPRKEVRFAVPCSIGGTGTTAWVQVKADGAVHWAFPTTSSGVITYLFLDGVAFPAA